MWTKPNIPRLLTVVTLLAACCSAVNADPLRVITPPSPGQERSAQANTSSKVITAPPGAQTTAPRTQTDEPVPGDTPNARPQPRAYSQGCSSNEARLPCLTIQQVILSPGSGRQIDFGRAFAKIMVADPEVIYATPINDHELFIRPLRQEQSVTQNSGNTSTTYTSSKPTKNGNSDIFIYDKDDTRIGVIDVTIDEFAFKQNSVFAPDEFAARAGAIVIIRGNKPYYYRCAGGVVGGCAFEGN